MSSPCPDATHYVREPSTAELAKSVDQPESFKLKYFPMNAVGATSRDILSYGQAKWENLAPANWGEEKYMTPFNCMPVLYIHTKDGKDLVISEAFTVEHYLAKHFDLLGDNEYEAILIKSFHSSSSFMQSTFATMVTWTPAEVQAKNLAFFKNFLLPTWVQTHSKHLIDNGDNGHYMGNRLSLADIRTANAIEHLAVQPCAEELLEIVAQSPQLLKVRETVANDPRIAAWRASEAYKTLHSGSKAFFVNPMKFVPKPKEA
ncbi:Glutathione S-transferase S1 [Gryganskiella cystojenkinii]|nr:Glutathione S-transferase S1 [Gryganskiella cystojenkinii]